MIEQDSWSGLQTILILGFFALVIYGIYVKLTGQDPGAQMGREINRLREANKHKPPIVYLRSFASDTLQLSDIKNAFVGKTLAGTMAYWKDAGHMVTDLLTVIAPMKELTAPETSWRLKPWAPSRPESVAVGNDVWQRQILGWLVEAPLVVIQLDISAGLAWELEQVVRLVSPTKVLLVLPPTQGEYDEIRAGVEGFFPLPSTLPDSRLLTFNSKWQPCPLPVPGQVGTWQTLELVFEQNGYESPPWRRIYGIGSNK